MGDVDFDSVGAGVTAAVVAVVATAEDVAAVVALAVGEVHGAPTQQASVVLVLQYSQRPSAVPRPSCYVMSCRGYMILN